MSVIAFAKKESGPRCVALIGPYGSGKTTLLEALLWSTGAIQRKGGVSAGNSVGDASAEARAHRMGVEVNAASFAYLGEPFTVLDCPGSIEFLQETLNVLPGIDEAIVVCEPDPAKAAMLQPYLKRLQDLKIPHTIFVNKIDKANARLRDLLAALQRVSERPLVARQIPIWDKGIVKGFVDLALERAFVYREHAASQVVEMKDEVRLREEEARFTMLERLADYDDHLMEELLSDIPPPRDEVFANLKRELREGLIVPVMIGSAERDNGVRRLLKVFRHETPGVEACAQRHGVTRGETALAVLKTYHTPHGKLSLARVLAGSVKDGQVLYSQTGEARVGGLFALKGEMQTKRGEACAGDVVALGRLDHVVTGDVLAAVKGQIRPRLDVERLSPVYSLAIAAAERKDEVKLTGAIARLCEEDPSLGLAQDGALHQMTLLGQGEIHLKVAMEKLAGKYGLKLAASRPQVPYKESIRKHIRVHGRHKRQTGGHGQFADVVLEIQPLPRGAGFAFTERITGGAVPRNFIPSVEKGVSEYLHRGPLGFPVVDLAVTLTDGSYHAVDSSDAAFQTAARIAMSDGLPDCVPVLLEPIMHVRIHVPSEATPKTNAVISSRRGQILGFDARPGWRGWDSVEAEMPQAELHDLIVELRSLTQGAGTYDAEFDHLAELTGKLAEHVVHTKAA